MTRREAAALKFRCQPQAEDCRWSVQLAFNSNYCRERSDLHRKGAIPAPRGAVLTPEWRPCSDQRQAVRGSCKKRDSETAEVLAGRGGGRGADSVVVRGGRRSTGGAAVRGDRGGGWGVDDAAVLRGERGADGAAVLGGQGKGGGRGANGAAVRGGGRGADGAVVLGGQGQEG